MRGYGDRFAVFYMPARRYILRTLTQSEQSLDCLLLQPAERDTNVYRRISLVRLGDQDGLEYYIGTTQDKGQAVSSEVGTASCAEDVYLV